MTLDVLVRGGLVFDGTGSQGRTMDIGIRDGVIVEVGRIEERARRTVDAEGLIVTPGFVDIHVHYDGQAVWSERLTPSTWHGVTTMVAGNCGVGFAPARKSDQQRLIELMEGVEEIPGTALHEGLAWNWESFPEFLSVLGQRRWDADLGLQVPHAPLRVYAMGERASADQAASSTEIEVMARLATEGIAAGALGFSTSRTRNHRSISGELTPTLRAQGDELLAISRAIGSTGQGVLQVVSDFANLDEELQLIRLMAEQSRRPVSFSMADPTGDHWRTQLRFLERANEGGLRIRGQVSARAIGVMLGLACSLHPFQGNEVYAQISELSVEEQATILSRPEFKARLLAASTPPGRGSLADFNRYFELGVPPNYEPPPKASVAERARRTGRTPLDLVCELLSKGGGSGLIYVPIINWFGGNLDSVGEMLVHPQTVPGLSDGGAHVGSICDASFPTTLLTLWARDRDHGRIPLPFLIRRQTRESAVAVGLFDRGLIARGYRADINVIDFDGLQVEPPEISRDLPAGGSRLVQGASGYVLTLVAGVVTYERGHWTGNLPGRLLRGPQPDPRARAA